jgi:hypothetical protein
MRVSGEKVVVAMCAVFLGCAGEETVGESQWRNQNEDTVEVQSGLVVSTFFDDSASPLHIQVKSCTADNFGGTFTIDCQVDSGYALVGGGAWANYTSGGALLVQSRPFNNRTWRGGSKEHQNTDNHKLTVYAVGMRLDGVNAATLRGMITRTSSTSSSGSNPNVTHSPGSIMLSGGASTTTGGSGQLLTRSNWTGSGTWRSSSKDHIVTSTGTVTAHATRLITSGIIEPLGALELQQKDATTSSSGTGVRTSTGTVNTGWAVVGYGGLSSWTSGPGRLLFRMGMNGTNIRNVIASTKDHITSSSGNTKASWSQARHKAGSHGMCNPGPPLQASFDPCVASICAVDSFCCNSLWDPACVAKVTSVCGKSCTNFTCSTPSYSPSFWNDGGTVQGSNNCYNYGNNKRTDTFAQPGSSSGEECPFPPTAACITTKATADGLIPSPGINQCDWDQQSVAMAIAPGPGFFDYHWYRQDSNFMWSHKPGGTQATNLDSSGNPISDPATADRGDYTIFGGYFCTCSDSVQGQGHAIIN